MALIACGEDEAPPPAAELMADSVFIDFNGAPIDTDGDGNDTNRDGVQDEFESSTFIDRNRDGQVDEMDHFDFDRDGVPDDFNADGRPDNRFYFDDQADWIPDADSFDDYQDEEAGIPRAVTAIRGNCPADGIVTGPLDPIVMRPNGEPFAAWEPSKWCKRVKDDRPEPPPRWR